jgi:hypothetical protein
MQRILDAAISDPRTEALAGDTDPLAARMTWQPLTPKRMWSQDFAGLIE